MSQNQTQPVEVNQDNIQEVINQAKKKLSKVFLTLQIGTDDTYTSTGETILEAVNNLKTPKYLTAKGFIKVEADGKTATRQLTIPRLRRLFSVSGTIRDYSRQVIAKQLGLFLE